MPASPHDAICERTYDLLIIGAGINGAGIARDAAGRGLSVLLCEQGDIGGATSSASSKLIHGGLRYLEQGEFRLVAEALAEREVMLRIAPHLAHPLHFVLPHAGSLRPAWMVRLGLLLYDGLSWLHQRRGSPLTHSRTLDLRHSPLGSALRPEFARGYAYFDVAVDDARLTLANARAAADLGAVVLRDTRFVTAQREEGGWLATLDCPATGLAEQSGDRSSPSSQGGTHLKIKARTLINAAGPWVAKVLASLPREREHAAVQLVKGSHIVVPKLYPGEHAYILQNDDGRVVFLLPFEREFTLIGTTDIKVGTPEDAQITSEEVDYLCRAVNRYSRRQIRPEDALWHYAGIRPLFDDGHGNPSAVTRDYHFVLDGKPTQQAPVLSIFGGKLTTYRRLAERALAKLTPWLARMGPAWTGSQPLPGGNFSNLTELDSALARHYPALPANLLNALARRHGQLTYTVLGDIASCAELGHHFGANLYQREVEYFIEREWAHSADDILWRRSKAGLSMSQAQQTELSEWLR
jgi:glycerol-3-phosphate dehydrogenase